jgi:hypothetical protein
VAARAETPAEDSALAQAGGLANPGGLPIRANEVSISAGLATKEQWLLLYNLDPGAPGKPHAQFLTARNQQRVETQTANADAGAALETGFCLVMAGKKCDAVEGRAIVHRCVDAKRCQVSARIRHQPLAAGLVDGRMKGVSKQYIQTFLP